MKNKNFLLFCLLMGITSFLFSQNFNEKFAKLDSMQNNRKLVLNGKISPKNFSNDSFVYEVREKNGLVWYKVNLQEKFKTLIERPEIATDKKTEEKGDSLYISPDKMWEVFIKDCNVCLRNIENKEVTQITFDGTTNLVYEHFLWSPDSKKVAALKTRQTTERKIPLLESSPKNQIQPILQWRDYAKPGDVLNMSIPVLIDIENKKIIHIDTKAYENQYQLFIKQWLPNSSGFIFEFNERGHQNYQVLKVDANNGKITTIVDEKSNTFIYYYCNYSYYSKDGKYLIWASERDNYRHLYQIDANNGQIIKQLTNGNFVVRNVITINEDDQFAIIAVSGINKVEDPYNIHYYRLDLNSGKLVDLTPENANHSATFSPDFSYFVDNYSRPDLPNATVIRSSKDGSIIMNLHNSGISALLKTGFTIPEVICTKGRDGETEIWGNIYRPSNFDPKKRYPIVEYIYAGPHDSFVNKEFSGFDRFSKLLELGFIVVTIDGMGTDNRSKSFQDVCWRNLKDAGLPDRIIWIKEVAKKYKYMDINRVGIYGYSAGGQSAMAALLYHNDFYKVAVSLCGCHDNRMDKIWWNEQWMGYPIGPWYSESSNVDNAHLLKGKLFLINGELDDNVDPASTLQVVDALIKAKIDFEQLYLPNYGHSLGDDFVTKRVFEFFYRNL